MLLLKTDHFFQLGTPIWVNLPLSHASAYEVILTVIGSVCKARTNITSLMDAQGDSNDGENLMRRIRCFHGQLVPTTYCSLAEMGD
jgi:hypothetical protein